MTAGAQQLTLAAMPAGSAEDTPPPWMATVTARPAPDLRDYDVILVSLSGGGDSQATAGHVAAAADATDVSDRQVAVHCDLGEEEWPESPEFAALHAAHFGIPRFEIVRRELTDPASGQRHPQGLLEHIAARGMFPDAARRYCTSDMKTGPTRRLMTALVRELDPRQLGRPVRILDVQGLRADESPTRRQLPPYSHNRRASNPTRRHVDTWYPIHGWTKSRVRAYCDASGVAHHPAYDDPPGSGNWAGMPRISCSFCVLAGRDALILAARRRPDLAARYLEVERRIGHRFKAGQSMAQIVQAAAAPAGPAAPIQEWLG
jgi:3'-phosphoadenosine 5'-phosphosulfate sulfotransferase (PAPS reductase)/FAD synthetase